MPKLESGWTTFGQLAKGETFYVGGRRCVKVSETEGDVYTYRGTDLGTFEFDSDDPVVADLLVV